MVGYFFKFTFVRKLLFVVVLLILSIALPYFFIRFGKVVFISVLGVSSLVLLFLYELQNRKSLTLVILLVVSIPFHSIFLTTYPMRAIGQFIPILIVVFYWNIYDLYTQNEYLRRIKPLFFPTAAFVFSFFLSYFISGNLEKNNWSFLINLVGAVGYAFLGCLYCTSMKNIKKLLWILIGIGLIQLPVMYAMSRGWTESLPGDLATLSNQSWGGFASTYETTTLRYPGTFPSYELLAEYLDMMVLFCIGIFIFTPSRKERLFALISAGGIIIAGFFTGTRVFIFGIGAGSAVMVSLIAIKQGFGKNIVKLIIMGSFFVLVILFFSTQEIFRGYINRFLATDLSAGYYDTRDTVWNISFILIQKVPFTGYGSRMQEIFNTQGGDIISGPHSLYFSMLLIAGYPGLMAIFIMVYTPVVWMSRILFSRNKNIYYEWSIIMMSVWIFWAVNEIKIEFIRHPSTMNILFLLFGIFASYYDLARRNPTIIKQ